MNFNFAMSLGELKKRTSPRFYKPIKFLNENSREFARLSVDEKLVLTHLVRAASYFDVINLKLENHHNLEFLEFLKQEIEKGNKKAELALKLFNSQKSMFSPDTLGNQTALVKNVKKSEGCAYYPEDLTEKEFVKIISDMLQDGEIEEVKKILSQRTIVVRDGEKLKAIDFIDVFEEFKDVAKELDLAKQFSKNKKFNDYLDLQIKALEKADPMLDAKADKAWAKLDEKCPFEFTITRESYGENMTKSVLENEDLAQKLKENKIEVYSKDFLGARVGIVNKNGTKLLKRLKDLIKVSAKHMPYSDEYQNDFNDGSKESEQTAVDVDLITLTGDEGAYRASIVLAQNLPNDDKLSLEIGGGRRNVYHRQVRKKTNRKLYKNLISESDYKYFNPEADHWAVICHENTHSLGPKSHGSLGKFSSILEEYKADLGMYAFLDEFVQAGYFDKEKIKQIMVTSLAGSFVKGKPTLAEAHRTREVMICHRMISEGAIKFDGDGKLVFDFEKVKKTAKAMMEEVIRLQIDGDISAAKKYIDKWFVWSDQIAAVAEIIKKHSKKLNGYLIEPLKDAMLKNDFEEKIKRAWICALFYFLIPFLFPRETCFLVFTKLARFFSRCFKSVS